MMSISYYMKRRIKKNSSGWYCGMYVDVIYLIRAAIDGYIDWPKFFPKYCLPRPVHIPRLITCSSAINERKNDLKYPIFLSVPVLFNELELYLKRDNIDIMLWVIANCEDEWYFDSSPFPQEYKIETVTYPAGTSLKGTSKWVFVREEDAMAFKLRWG